MEEILKKIRTDFRRYMNGVVSYDMRKKGVHYTMNFGIDVPRLREMAKKYDKNKELATYMYGREVREMKIMSTMLYPVEQMTEEEAMEWIEKVDHQEVREHLCMNILQHLPFAYNLVENCIVSSKLSLRMTAYLLYSRLAISKNRQEGSGAYKLLIPIAIKDFGSDSILTKQAAFNALRNAGKSSTDAPSGILSLIKEDDLMSVADREHLYDSLKDEFELLGYLPVGDNIN